MSVYVRRSEDNFVESVLTLDSYVDLEDQTQAVWLVGQGRLPRP